jgi:hypothetical protein
MRRSRLATVVAVGTLAAGIGPNTAVFTVVVDWVLLRTLPYPAPHELVRIWTAGIKPITAATDLTPFEVRVPATARSLRSVTAYSMATRVARSEGVEPFHAVVTRLDGDWSAVGMVGAVAVSRFWLSTRLPAIGAADPLTLLSVPLALTAVGLLAAVLAGRRVLRADPAETLRL